MTRFTRHTVLFGFIAVHNIKQFSGSYVLTFPSVISFFHYRCEPFEKLLCKVCCRLPYGKAIWTLLRHGKKYFIRDFRVGKLFLYRVRNLIDVFNVSAFDNLTTTELNRILVWKLKRWKISTVDCGNIVARISHKRQNYILHSPSVPCWKQDPLLLNLFSRDFHFLLVCPKFLCARTYESYASYCPNGRNTAFGRKPQKETGHLSVL